MKKASQKNKIRPVFMAAAIGVAFFVQALNAEAWYLQINQYNTDKNGAWMDSTSTLWNNASDGSGDSITYAPKAGDIYDINNYESEKWLRSSSTPFAGSIKIYGSKSGGIHLKHRSSTLNGDLLIVGNATIQQGVGAGDGTNKTTLSIKGTLLVDSGATLKIAKDSGGDNQIHYTVIQAAVLSGSGNISIDSRNTIRRHEVTLAATDASTFTGTITVAQYSTLTVTDEFDSQANMVATNASTLILQGDIILDSLTLNTGSTLSLDNASVTLSSFTIGSTALEAGRTYTMSELMEDYSGFFASGSTGSIIIASMIPEPASIALVLSLAIAGTMLVRRRQSKSGI